MTSPSAIYEQEKITLWNSKVDLAKSMQEGKLMSSEFIYRHVFIFSDDEIRNIKDGIVDDQNESFRLTKISEEGEDPANPVAKSDGEGEEGGEEEAANPFGGGGGESEEEGGEEINEFGMPEIWGNAPQSAFYTASGGQTIGENTKKRLESILEQARQNVKNKLNK
jgi:hypothetical protein